jgi:hypothetical protein
MVPEPEVCDMPVRTGFSAQKHLDPLRGFNERKFPEKFSRQVFLAHGLAFSARQLVYNK